MKKQVILAAFMASSGACSDPPPPQPPPPPPPAPVPVADPAPLPPAPAPARDARKDNILSVLDQIDEHAQKIESGQAHGGGHTHGGAHAEGSAMDRSHKIEGLTASIAEPITHYSAAAPSYAELVLHSKKLHVALTAHQTKDTHHHVHEIRKAVKATKAALQ